MSDSTPLFDGSDVVGITWGPRLSTDGQPTDVAGLRRWADQIEQDGGPEEATLDPIGLLRSAADELDANRAEITALKKGAATMSRKMAALQRFADSKSLDVTVPERS